MKSPKFFISAAVALLAMSVSLPAAAGTVSDVSAAIQQANIPVSRLSVTETEGIVILSGRVTSAGNRTLAGEVASNSGRNRVANMIQVVALPDDELIAREAERILYLTRGLEGCLFRVTSDNGQITVTGTVDEEVQKDLAVVVLGRIDGVTAVRSNLSRV